MQTLLHKAFLISGLALGVAVLAAVPTRSLPLQEATSVAVRVQHNVTDERHSTHYYFPSQFSAPEGPVAEPIATF